MFERSKGESVDKVEEVAVGVGAFEAETGEGVKGGGIAFDERVDVRAAGEKDFETDVAQYLARAGAVEPVGLGVYVRGNAYVFETLEQFVGVRG